MPNGIEASSCKLDDPKERSFTDDPMFHFGGTKHIVNELDEVSECIQADCQGHSTTTSNCND
jgi:hypothetical protein